MRGWNIQFLVLNQLLKLHNLLLIDGGDQQVGNFQEAAAQSSPRGS
jgi:hypothetical protein